MKGLGLVLLLAMLIVMIVFTLKDKKNDQGETYQEEMADVMDKAEETAMESKFRHIKDALNSYYMDHGEYPEMLDQMLPNYAANYDMLTDLWGTRFMLESDEDMNLEIVSAGKDRTFNTEDDIRRRI